MGQRKLRRRPGACRDGRCAENAPHVASGKVKDGGGGSGGGSKNPVVATTGAKPPGTKTTPKRATTTSTPPTEVSNDQAENYAEWAQHMAGPHHGCAMFDLLCLLYQLTPIPDLIGCGQLDVESCAWLGLDLFPGGRVLKGIDDVADIADAARDADRAVNAACSFSGDTEVLMADGSTKPIKDVHVGEQIEATDPETGETGGRTVAAVWHHPDVVLDLVTEDDATVTTTEDHPFWNATDHEWQQARQLDAGDEFHTAKPGLARVKGLDLGTAHVAIAYNFTVKGIHTYYVLIAGQSVLVHNGGPGCGTLWMSPDKLPHHYMKVSDEGLSHAADFGVKGPYNKANGQAFIKVIDEFVRNPGTWQIRGTFRGQAAVHYVDDTGLHVSFAADGPRVGEYLGGWRSSGDQFTYLLIDGKL